MSSIEPKDFYKLMMDNIGKYEERVTEKLVKEKVSELGKQAKPEIKGYSIKNVQLYRTGEYQKGWVLRSTRKKGVASIKLYNKNKPSLVHLLEFGHKGPFPAKAYPHVRRTELKYNKLLYEELRKELE